MVNAAETEIVFYIIIILYNYYLFNDECHILKKPPFHFLKMMNIYLFNHFTIFMFQLLQQVLWNILFYNKLIYLLYYESYI